MPKRSAISLTKSVIYLQDATWFFRRGIERARDLGFSPELLQQAFWDTLGSKSPFAVFCAKVRFGLEALTHEIQDQDRFWDHF